MRGALLPPFIILLSSCSLLPASAPTRAIRIAGAPEIFAPGVISVQDRTEQGFTMSADGRLAVFSVLSGRVNGRNSWSLMISELVDGSWSTPTVAPFSGRYPDYGPALSPDGAELYFMSRRPIEGDTARTDYDIYVVVRVGDGWGTPRRLPEGINTDGEEYSVAVSDRALYFVAERADTRGHTDLYRSERVGGQYSTPVNMGAPINTEHWEGSTYVAPDENLIVLTSHGRSGADNEQIYVATRNGSEWNEPIALDEINTEANEFTHHMARDRSALYFSRGGEIYRVALRPGS